MAAEMEWAGQIFQVVCVVEDLDGALNNWKEMVEFDTASIRTAQKEAQCVGGGAPLPCPIRQAVFDLGGVEVRLVEPLDKDGPDPYAQCLREKGPGFHHLGIYTERREELIARYGAMGIAPAFTEDGRPLYDFDDRLGFSFVPWDRMSGPCGRQADPVQTMESEA